MSYSVACFLLRRSLRCSFFYPSSLISKHRQNSSISPTPLTSRVLIPQTITKNPSSLTTRFASSKALSTDDKIKRADDNLLRILECEIECTEEEEADQEAALPKDIPFKIIGNPGDQVIILMRELAAEEIRAMVRMNFHEEVEQQDDDSAGDALQPSVSLVVTINKESGPALKFRCNLDADDVEIENMALKVSKYSEYEAYQGPAFSDLDKSLQKALRKYLAVRGIKGSLYAFLCKYMMNKDGKEAWLKNLKEFVEK